MTALKTFPTCGFDFGGLKVANFFICFMRYELVIGKLLITGILSNTKRVFDSFRGKLLLLLVIDAPSALPIFQFFGEMAEAFHSKLERDLLGYLFD